MKKFLFIIPLFILCCTTSNVTPGRSGKTALIVPFTSGDNFKSEVYNEAEESFRSALVKMGYKVIRKDVFKESEFSDGGFSTENIIRIGKALGVSCILKGEIISNKEFQKGEYQYSSFIHGSQVMRDEKFSDINTSIVLKFQASVTLFNAADGAVLLALKNSPGEADKNVNQPELKSLEAYRIFTLNKMADEFVQIMKKK